MAYQSQSNGVVAFKAQASKGSTASGGSGFVLRIAGGGGLRLSKRTYGSNEVRRDLMRSRGRHGLRQVSGSYTCELSLDNHDAFYEALFRGTWSSALTKTEANFTSLAVASNVITLGSGSPITMGYRVGDIVRLTNMSAAGNNNRNLRITAMTATTITVVALDGVALTDQGADTTATITRPGQKLINPASPAAPTYFTIEEWDGDLDLARIFSDCRITSMRFSMAPNGLVTVEIGFTGTGLFGTASGGSAPSLTSPSESTGLPLSAADSVVRLGSAVLAELTSFDLSIDIGAVAPEVVASEISPDVFTGAMGVSMNLGMLMTDYTHLTAFADETALSLSVAFQENEAAPEDFVSLFIPNFTLGGFDLSPLSPDAGARTVTLAVPAELVGKDTTGGAYDGAMAVLQVSNT